MVEYSAFAAPEVWLALRAGREPDPHRLQRLIWLQDLRRQDRREAKKRRPKNPPRSGKLQPHVPWI